MIRRSHYQVLSRYADESFSGTVRLAVLADLHNHVYRSDTDRLIQAIWEEGCDAVLSAGDLVVRKGEIYETDQALKLVCTLAETMPVFVADGNHESRMKRCCTEQYRVYERTMKRAGIVRVHNDTALTKINGVKLAVTGLELDRRYFRNKYHKNLYEAEISKRVGKRRKDMFQILLAHHPKYFPVYARWGADLVLSGHLHGGIVRLPALGGLISPDPELFPYYDHGLYREGASSMIVSAGLGTHTLDLRINNPPELVIVDILA